jgi:hypothetical protein
VDAHVGYPQPKCGSWAAISRETAAPAAETSANLCSDSLGRRSFAGIAASFHERIPLDNKPHAQLLQFIEIDAHDSSPGYALGSAHKAMSTLGVPAPLWVERGGLVNDERNRAQAIE